MKHRDIRLWFLPEELTLLHTLVMDHVGRRIADRELEPWEAKLLAKLGRSRNQVTERRTTVL